MDDRLAAIINSSSFDIREGEFVYTKVRHTPQNMEQHFMVSGDETEITVVTRQENLDTLELIERNNETYRLIALNVSVPFYSVGFLAAVSNAIADAGLDILIVSTYSKDYILVKREVLSEAEAALMGVGLLKRPDVDETSNDRTTSCSRLTTLPAGHMIGIADCP